MPNRAPSKEEQERIAAFMAGYEALVKEHRVDIFSFPVWEPNGRPGGFSTVLQRQPILTDRTEEGVKSPDEFIPKA